MTAWCTARVRPSKRWRAAIPGSRWGWWPDVLAFVLATYFRSAMPLAAGILLIVAGQALRLSRLPKDILSHLTDTGRREL